MQQIRAKADRQVTSLLDFTFWSDLIVILAIVGINIVNILRANSGQSALVTAAEPELVLIVSFALVLYLGYGCVQALSIKSRMNRVFMRLVVVLGSSPLPRLSGLSYLAGIPSAYVEHG